MPQYNNPPQTNPNFLNGGLVVKQLPLRVFSGDIFIPASSEISINIQELLVNCSGFLLESVTGFVQISVNGGGLRTVIADQQFNDCDIFSLRVVTGPVSSVIVQLHGE